ncbi:hypothetical protein LOTGIDRAFT_175960, partial [Lottia gigantea]
YYIDGCQPGFISIDCTQGFISIDCTQGKYNIVSTVYNNINSRYYIDGCQPGFISIDCTQGFISIDCTQGKYNIVSTVYNNINGRYYIDGCQPGFISIDCTQGKQFGYLELFTGKQFGYLELFTCYCYNSILIVICKQFGYLELFTCHCYKCILIVICYLYLGKQFGYLELFTCHCTNDNDCNTDGSCQSNGCATGWYGSTCQKQNVALGKPASQVSQYDVLGPELAVDGDRSQDIFRCMNTGYNNNSWWSVNLIDTYSIRQIHILYRQGDTYTYPGDTDNSIDEYLYTLKGFKIDVIQDNGASVECYKQPNDIQPSSIDFTVNCNKTIWGSKINISRTIVIEKLFYSFCEVEVYVCSNRTYGEECMKYSYCKDNIIVNICYIIVCSNRTYGEELCSNRTYGEECMKYSYCKDNIIVNICYIIVCSNRTYGEALCSNRTYGKECEKFCYCKDGVPCDYITGVCSTEGCLPGYTGSSCNQKCPTRTYGRNCLQLCSNNCLNLECNNMNGICIGGCKPGFKSELCNQ